MKPPARSRNTWSGTESTTAFQTERMTHLRCTIDQCATSLPPSSLRYASTSAFNTTGSISATSTLSSRTAMRQRVRDMSGKSVNQEER